MQNVAFLLTHTVRAQAGVAAHGARGHHKTRRDFLQRPAALIKKFKKWNNLNK